LIALSDDTKDRIRLLFSDAEQPRVEGMLLTRCGDTLPLVATSYTLLAERIRFAVLKLSGGNFTELERHIANAERDWRDVLVAAGFGNSLEAHKNWRP
jgi:hypothetical protein